MYKKIIKIYNSPKEKKFKDKLEAIISDGISVDDANKLLMYFCTRKRKNIMEIILNHHPAISEIDVTQFIKSNYMDGIILLLRITDMEPAELLVDEKVRYDAELVSILLNHCLFLNHKSMMRVSKFCEDIPNEILEMIADKFFSLDDLDPDFYFVFLSYVIPNKEFATYIINNFNKWGNFSSHQYVSAIYNSTIIYYNFESQKMIYEHMHHLFPDADYSYLIEKIIIYYNGANMLKLILTDKPDLVDYAVELLRESRINEQACKIVLALTDSVFIKQKFSTPCGLINKFNKNPHEVRKNLRRELKLTTNSAKIFALTIFLCDDFFVIRTTIKN